MSPSVTSVLVSARRAAVASALEGWVALGEVTHPRVEWAMYTTWARRVRQAQLMDGEGWNIAARLEAAGHFEGMLRRAGSLISAQKANPRFGSLVATVLDHSAGPDDVAAGFHVLDDLKGDKALAVVQGMMAALTATLLRQSVGEPTSEGARSLLDVAANMPPTSPECFQIVLARAIAGGSHGAAEIVRDTLAEVARQEGTAVNWANRCGLRQLYLLAEATTAATDGIKSFAELQKTLDARVPLPPRRGEFTMVPKPVRAGLQHVLGTRPVAASR